MLLGLIRRDAGSVRLPFETPTNWGSIGHAIWISMVYAAPPLIAARLVFRRRDVAT